MKESVEMKRKVLVLGVALAVVGLVSWLCAKAPSEAAGEVSRTSSSTSGICLASSTGQAVAAVSAAAVSTNQTPTARGTLPYVLTCAVPFDKPLRLAAEATGVRTVGLLSPKRLLVEADAATHSRLALDGRFDGIEEFSPSGKIQSSLVAALASGAATVDVSIVALSEADRSQVIARLEAGGGMMLTGCINEGATIRARLPSALVTELAHCGDVRWLEAFERPVLLNDLAVEPGAMNVTNVWGTHGLTGSGQVISTSDSGIDTGDVATMHQDLRDRVLGIKMAEGASATDISGHGTHTAGSIVGTGALSDGQIRGTAYGANLYAWFCGDPDKEHVIMPSTLSALYTADGEWDAHIHSASWGSSVNGRYNAECADHDLYVWKNPEFLPVFAAGNDGSGRCTVGSPGAAKNVLTVGATQNLRTGHDGGRPNGDPTVATSFSSRGPCQDGRIKPDIAAPGAGIVSVRSFEAVGDAGKAPLYGVYEGNTNYLYCSGTSMSCPLTAGAVALVRQWLVEEKGFEDVDGKRPTAALMKAVITGGAKGDETPNEEQGWGRVDLEQTLFPSDGLAVKLVDRLPFVSGTNFVYVIETTNAAPLDVQLVWVDYPGAAVDSGEPRLVNDLDLTVETRLDNEDLIWYGNGGSEPDTRNNVESVRLSSVAKARYVITVSCPHVLHDYMEGGAAALYVRGAFDPSLELPEPAYVRIVERDLGYRSLDKALANVRDGETVQVLDWTTLHARQSVGACFTLYATNTNPSASLIRRKAHAGIDLVDGSVVLMSNLVFAASVETVVTVADGSQLRLGDNVDFSVPSVQAAVHTETETGLSVVAPLVHGFTLQCETAQELCNTCAVGHTVSETTFAGITNTAGRIANYYDPTRELRAQVSGGPNNYLLIWTEQPVPIEDAAGYYLDKDGGTNTAARLDRLLKFYEDAKAAGRIGAVHRLVFRKGDTLSRPLTVVDGLSLTGEGAPVVELAGTAGFTLTGGTLDVSGIVFSNYVGNAVFLVNGEAAALNVGSGTVFADIKGTNAYSGAVAILKGSATIGGGTIFERCKATGEFSNSKSVGSFGGAVYVERNAKLALSGCTMTGCEAADFGGAVYAKQGAEVRLSGELRITGNCNHSTSANNDDIHLRNPKTNPARLILAGPVSGRVGVSWGYDEDFSKFGNADGKWLVETDVPLYAHESAGAFFCDGNDGLVAEPIEANEAAGLVWHAVPSGPQPCDPEEASARVTFAAGGDPVCYLLVSEALEALADETLAGEATVEIIGGNGCYIDTDLVWTNPVHVTLKSGAGMGCRAFERRGNCSFRIASGASLTLQDVVVRGCEMTTNSLMVGELVRVNPDERTEVPVFDVAGGSLILKTPSAVGYESAIEHVYGDTCREAGAVHVTGGGTFEMEGGTAVRHCFNRKSKVSDGTGHGAAVLVDDGTANLKGGSITDCQANNGGGVFIGSRGIVNVSGDCRVDGNLNLRNMADNLYVSDTSGLVLTHAFTGKIGFTSGISADSVVFGRVSEDFPEPLSNCVASAHNFCNDRTGDIGMVVSNGTERLLVWGSALAQDGTYTAKSGVVYALVSGTPAKVVVPEAAALVYDGTEKVGVPETVGCLVSGNVATNAGFYSATVTPRVGFAWADGSTDAKTVDWSIAKATYDMSGVQFNSVTNDYNGQFHVLKITGTLPVGVEDIYENNIRREIGSQEATVTFSGDVANYNPIVPSFLKATLTVKSPLTDPLPPTDEPAPVVVVVTNYPTGIAFQSIDRVNETVWRLVVTNRVKYCRYRLLQTADLKADFSPVGDWIVADSAGAWTTNVTTSGGQRFWRAEGTWGIVPSTSNP